MVSVNTSVQIGQLFCTRHGAHQRYFCDIVKFAFAKFPLSSLSFTKSMVPSWCWSLKSMVWIPVLNLRLPTPSWPGTSCQADPGTQEAFSLSFGGLIQGFGRSILLVTKVSQSKVL